jgi:hypothetical protein
MSHSRRLILTEEEWLWFIPVILLSIPMMLFILDILNKPISVKPSYDTYQSISRPQEKSNTINYYNVQVPDAFKITFGNDLNLNEYQRN